MNQHYEELLTVRNLSEVGPIPLTGSQQRVREYAVHIQRNDEAQLWCSATNSESGSGYSLPREDALTLSSSEIWGSQSEK